MILKPIKNALKILNNPETEFSQIHKRKFEDILSDYLILLVVLSITAGLVSFIFYLVKAFYLDIFLTVDVNYMRMLNYSLGRTTSLMFFYMFAGTFLVFIISLMLRLFVHVKYVQLFSIMFYSLTPFLLFAWIPILGYSLFIWTVFLFFVGLKHKKQFLVKKDSIKQRD